MFLARWFQVSRKADSEQETGLCPSRKLVYAANGPGGVESDASVIELIFDSKHKDDLETAANSAFELREYRNNETGWTYTGKFLKERLPAASAFCFFSLESENPC